MSDPADADRKRQLSDDLLRRIQDARRAFHYALTYDVDARERMFSPAILLQTLRKHVDMTATGTTRERCGRLFVLTVVLYASLDWTFAGQGVDVDAIVQTERIRQTYRFGGPQIDDRLAPRDWQTRLRHQILRLEQQLAVEELYAARLVKLTAIAHAALEATSRQLQCG
jgi:hypothetical protein